MLSQDNFGPLTLTGIAHRCKQETERFFSSQHHDPRFCFELFRRAIVEADHRAWELVYRQYQSLVAGWVVRHPAFPVTGEEVDYFINRAYEKMWVALTPEKFAHFAELRSILRYLQMCVHSVIADCVRSRTLETVQLDHPLPIASNPATDSVVEEQVLTRMRRDELWRCLNRKLKNDQERCVVYGSFVLALKPRELYAQHGETFRDVQEVYRIKENVMVRLRRDSELIQFLDDA